MNDKPQTSSLSENVCEEVLTTRDISTSTVPSPIHQDESKRTQPRSTSRSRKHHRTAPRLSLRNFLKAFKSYVLSSEDDLRLQSISAKSHNKAHEHTNDRVPMIVIVDSNCISNPSSRELAVNRKTIVKENVLKKRFNNNVVPNDLPSTSKGTGTEFSPFTISSFSESESVYELQMIDINLQSEHEITLEDSESYWQSVVLSCLRNKDAFLDAEGTFVSTKKKSSLLESVPKMETIQESEQFHSFTTEPRTELSSKISETSLEALIPSYPGSPRSLNLGSSSSHSQASNVNTAKDLMEAVEFIHEDNQFLLAAETGNVDLLTVLIRTGTNVKQRDLLGRNALHLAVCTNNVNAIKLLLQAGVDPNVTDDIGMTPLVLCLMRRPSLAVANLLFQYGAKLLPRMSSMDTGLFIQFVMMCTPTPEEAMILHLLKKKGALVDDPGAPGGRQALHFAAMSNNCPLVRILLELGADVFLTNHRDETPKEVAISFNCKEAAKLLDDFEDKLCGSTSGVK